jgi:hypothetical protein
MQNKPANIQPIAVAAAVANVLNCAITSLAGPVGMTHSQPYLLVTHVRAVNKTAAPRTISMYKGATGASAAGTEWNWTGKVIPANDAIDWYGRQRLDSADFLTAVADIVSGVVLEFDAEVGFA